MDNEWVDKWIEGIEGIESRGKRGDGPSHLMSISAQLLEIQEGAYPITDGRE